jgi:hypothetical protein
VGLDETGEAIKRNLDVLASYGGLFGSYELKQRLPHNKSSFT